MFILGLIHNYVNKHGEVKEMYCKKKEYSKKSSEMIWKMPERISIKKYPKMKRKNIIMINLLISMHE